MNKLKPCPFCGGEAVAKEATQDSDGSWHPASCGCRNCRVYFCGNDSYKHFGFAVADDYSESLRQAIAAWNTRAERTCEKLPSRSTHTCVVRYGNLEVEFGYWRCSECKCENFEGAKYCMNCGAKALDQ